MASPTAPATPLGPPIPAPPGKGLLVLAVLLLALTGVHRTTGAGWVAVVVSLGAGAIAVAALWPALVVARAEVSLGAPRDAKAGEPLRITAAVGGVAHPVRLRPLLPPGPPVGVPVGGGGSLATEPVDRGLVERLQVEVASAAPLGLWWWRRRYSLTLAHPTHVAPVATPATVPVPAAAGAAGERSVNPHGGELTRGVRGYQPGDAARLVHWPASARRGELVIRELDQPATPVVAVRVDVGVPGGEAAAARAAGLVADGLRHGAEVHLLTAEATGPAVGRVATALQAGRRLARAVPGPVPTGPLPGGALLVDAASPSGGGSPSGDLR